MDAIELMTKVKEGLAREGLPRTSRYAGGAVAGWTNAQGSTGFSIRDLGKFPSIGEKRRPGRLNMHVVVSGKAAGLSYRKWKEYDEHSGVMQMHEPLNPERLCAKIKVALEKQGLTVYSVTYGGHQMHWDDDVEFDAEVARPDGLVDPTAKERRAFW